MDLRSLETRLGSFEPIILNHPAGSLRVLDRAARVAFDIPPDVGNGTDVDLLLQQLAQSQDLGHNPALRISICVEADAFSLRETPQALVRLCEFLEPGGFKHISVHFDQPIEQWSHLHSALRLVREPLTTPRNVGMDLVGPFTRTSDFEMEAIFNLGVRIHFAAGWNSRCGVEECPEVDEEALRAFSEFGFRTVVDWFVHAGNISVYEQRIGRLLKANRSSGFALPLVCASPFYRFETGFPKPPQASRYCQLLVNAYKSHPHYDDVLAPLIDLALLVFDSGWHLAFDVPSSLNLSVNAAGEVGIYRQAPSLAVPWTTVSALVEMPPESLQSEFLGFVRREFDWGANGFCRPCRWKYVCGGLDAFSQQGHLSPSEMDVICSHRMLFLEHFALQRAPTPWAVMDGADTTKQMEMGPD